MKGLILLLKLWGDYFMKSFSSVDCAEQEYIFFNLEAQVTVL